MNRREEVAQEQLAKKLLFEARLERELKPIFKRMAEDARVAYKATQSPINARDYEEEFRVVLLRHYLRVTQYFGSQLRRQVKNAPVEVELKVVGKENKAIGETILLLLALFSRRQSTNSAALITDTNAKMIAESIGAAVARGILESLDSDRVGDLLGADMYARGYVRAPTIATTETQLGAEGGKYIEATSLVAEGATVTTFDEQGNPITAPLDEKVTRRWTAILDTRTREWHAIADGQRRGMNSPFEVDGERLMYPGDRSLGATGKNVINCRCNSDVMLDLPETRL